METCYTFFIFLACFPSESRVLTFVLTSMRRVCHFTLKICIKWSLQSLQSFQSFLLRHQGRTQCYAQFTMNFSMKWQLAWAREKKETYTSSDDGLMIEFLSLLFVPHIIQRKVTSIPALTVTLVCICGRDIFNRILITSQKQPESRDDRK